MASSGEYNSLGLDRPHSARMYDYYLGGKTNYAPDREAARKTLEVNPDIPVAARENRAFIHRVTRVLARDYGIRQWLDVGTGIPTSPNLHEVAQAIAPEARVVYVDNDPIVLAHARALLTSTPQGRTGYIQADVNDPDSIIASEKLAKTLDLSQPVTLSLMGVLHFITDDADAHGIVRRLIDALPSGSALALSHVTPDFNAQAWEKFAQITQAAGIPTRFRSKTEVEKFFSGLDLLAPGVVVCHRWRPGGGEELPRIGTDVTDAQVSLWGGVAFKP
ncbi:SAM-dependent methyltransferase [Streptomyces himalayensis]|uniref:SAM-dependent methyltransferase n=1 Tax=Streptomyces himalayensis subsp. himalayensis TaxID=2756131 RepID=A0A7W0DV35_9ACTN|nr:SAM-dependent methyltransferase [Streptomyces himalayensis]MBA2951760.1 SAM-dependent methyltransferase [Streptomyces himalayensis subsp. himalayensis]